MSLFARRDASLDSDPRVPQPPVRRRTRRSRWRGSRWD